MNETKWEPYDPSFAPHVKGRYTARVFDQELGMYEEQIVEAVCETCKATFRRACSSGLVRQHITRFASVHTHTDPFKANR